MHLFLSHEDKIDEPLTKNVVYKSHLNEAKLYEKQVMRDAGIIQPALFNIDGNLTQTTTDTTTNENETDSHFLENDVLAMYQIHNNKQPQKYHKTMIIHKITHKSTSMSVHKQRNQHNKQRNLQKQTQKNETKTKSKQRNKCNKHKRSNKEAHKNPNQ